MTRPLRIEYEDAIYHIMNRGLARQDIFLEEEDYECFLETLDEAKRIWKIKIYAYALMGNHYHLCLQTPGGNLSRVMRHIDGVYTQRFNRKHRRDGPLFRGRYKAILIGEENYLGQVIRYIHLNPVKAGLAKNPKEYRWSSHIGYIKAQRRPQWLAVERLLKNFEGPNGFNAYIMEGNDEETETFYRSKKQSPILGRDETIEKIREKGREPKEENTREEAQYLKPRVEKVIQAIVEQYGIKREKIEKGIRGQENEARHVAIYLSHEECDLKHKEIAQRFNINSYGVVGWHCSKVREKLKEDKRFEKRVRGIRERLRATIQQKT
ncbi:MAG: transposase [Chlamydiae bacterium]|nr:transposase [Chlamydiota bacterium]MBI3276874.1 transposase [Chlamydiota bacterium]